MRPAAAEAMVRTFATLEEKAKMKNKHVNKNKERKKFPVKNRSRIFILESRNGRTDPNCFLQKFMQSFGLPQTIDSQASKICQLV